MLSIIGVLVVIVGVLGGYMAAGGKLLVLVQPAEFLTLGGAAIGGMLICTPGYVLSATLKKLKKIFANGYSSQDFMDILVMQYELYNKVRKEGILSIEQDVSAPDGSAVFKRYPKFLGNHEAVDFYCDALRQLVNGIDATAIDLSMETDLETHEKEIKMQPQVLSRMADAFPGLGIVAAVLGIIITMGHLDGSPAELGHHIGAALVGTMLGVLSAYGFISPMSQKLETVNVEDEMYLSCLASGFRAFSQGLAPMVAIEVARKSLFHNFRPDLNALNAAAKKG
ncbi:MAG: flagellar motor stator protein MotA [Fibrobacterota bacterium]|nr:MAG: flagellar motor stator protein MotA [Fibrobacterota bacterium]